jgi:hypothetical protein
MIMNKTENDMNLYLEENKIFVLDTNVLLQDPTAILNFKDNTVVIPLTVIEELDRKKTDKNPELAKAARDIIRRLELLSNEGDINIGVGLPEHGLIRVETNIDKTMPLLTSDASINDNKILAAVSYVKYSVAAEGLSTPVVFVTRDLNLRLKARVAGFQAEDYKSEQVPEELYTGRTTGMAEYPNQFIESNGALKRYVNGVEQPLRHKSRKPLGVTPRNNGQYFMQEALLSSADIAPAVIIIGTAGTAKTFYSLACGLSETINGKYDKVLVCRPNSGFDGDIGFLPGDEKKKVSGLMRPIMDNLDVLLKNWQDPKGNNGKKERRLVSEKNRLKNLEKKRDSQYTPKNQKKKLKKQINDLHSVIVKLEKEINTATKSLSKEQIRGMIETESLTFIRGRSLTNTYLIIDEAQNLTVTQAKGILTRAGKGTKIVLCGDPEQIDKTYIDKRTNGLSYIMDKMKESPLAWQITMLQSECERSALANEAAKLL